MSFAPLILVVVAACLHAGWNLLAKQAAAGGPAFVLASNAVLCAAYAPWVLWLVAHDGMTWSWPVAACIGLSSLVNLAYSLSLQRGYQVADLSVVYPVARGTGPMLASLGAVLLLGEAFTGLGVLGLVAVIAGIGLISTQGSLSAFRRPGGLAGVVWGTTTGGLIAAYSVVDAYGVATLGIAPVALVWFSNVLRFPLLATAVLANPRLARSRMAGRWGLAVGVGLLSPLSYILVLAALDMGAPLSVVAPMREMSMMVGTLLGMVLLREPVGPWRLAGCAVLIGGVVVLGAST